MKHILIDALQRILRRSVGFYAICAVDMSAGERLDAANRAGNIKLPGDRAKCRHILHSILISPGKPGCACIILYRILGKIARSTAKKDEFCRLISLQTMAKPRLFFKKRCGFAPRKKAAPQMERRRTDSVYEIAWISYSATLSSENPLASASATAFAVSSAVRHGIRRALARRRIFTSSIAGSRPVAEVEIT